MNSFVVHEKLCTKLNSSSETICNMASRHPYYGMAFTCVSNRTELFQLMFPKHFDIPPSAPGQIPFSFVNDNYCDCSDGSDEPSTSACGSSTSSYFQCYVETKIVYASKIHDGICDCSDCSDESKQY